MSTKRNSENILLDPPSFDLPSDYKENPSDYELWAMRVPIKFDVSLLNGKSFPMKDMAENVPETVLTTFHIDDDNEDNSAGGNENGPIYKISMTQPTESQSFRILTSKQKGQKKNDDSDDDESDDDEEGKNQMIPIPIEFSRNLNVVEIACSKTKDLDVAPSMERAPEVDLVKEKMRIPYVKIDQKTGLKKRWNVFGSNVGKSGCLGNDNSQDKTKNNSSKNEKEGNNVLALTTPSRSSTSTKHTSKSTSSKTRKVSDDIVDNNNGGDDGGNEKKRKKSRKEKKSKKSKK